MIKIYTDGSATKTRAGWGFLCIVDDVNVDSDAGHFSEGTNQAMELMAIANACMWAENSIYYFEGHDVTIYSDSAYAINCYAEKWFKSWQNNNWNNSKGAPVANKGLWERLIPYFNNPRFMFEKVKGHSGHTYNDIADKLATGSKAPCDNLTTCNKSDTITIELSQILLDLITRTVSKQETIKQILSIMKREGVVLHG